MAFAPSVLKYSTIPQLNTHNRSIHSSTREDEKMKKRRRNSVVLASFNNNPISYSCQRRSHTHVWTPCPIRRTNRTFNSFFFTFINAVAYAAQKSISKHSRRFENTLSRTSRTTCSTNCAQIDGMWIRCVDAYYINSEMNANRQYRKTWFFFRNERREKNCLDFQCSQ